MATCKDCIHNDVCRGVYLAIQDNTKLTLKEFQILCEKEDFDNQDIALYDCLFFQDRSRFVELPCRPDDSLFVIVTDKNGNPTIEEYSVYAVIKKRDRTILETRIGRFTWGKEPCWLSHEEAEQALKEREKDE